MDTSVWIDFFRAGDRELAVLLDRGAVQVHDFVIGEIACGNLKNRQQTLYLLSCLPRSTNSSAEETLFFIERHNLMGRGIGYVDASILASAALTQSDLWSRDKRLMHIAGELGCAYVSGLSA
ncbi:type II toxin-antitoxin system VapC family toxin [Acidithiobacillus sp.]|uniref:type II toxin-antitoxin system VapC family toxin n=1 Tax=Acidithiobacillus sp. TaxID=1872118 RepID=UPI002617125F|nr:type II toxin-antitoxin system VapC family toxin [Acidithiobacillus sp.]MDD2749210.1 type II toxin-antitoxin system VapC family toxin [Acidithiobacillus sp.]MDD5279640.1 type II toxin-antitoxin system VapC family toxin [Acidithiobacillus sp.]